MKAFYFTHDAHDEMMASSNVALLFLELAWHLRGFTPCKTTKADID